MSVSVECSSWRRGNRAGAGVGHIDEVTTNEEPAAACGANVVIEGNSNPG